MKLVVAGQNYRLVGGADRALIQHCDLLRSAGHAVAPFCVRHPENLSSAWSRYFPDDVNFESPGLGDLTRYVYSAHAGRRFRELVGAFQPDIAHLHIYYGKLTGSIIREARLTGLPVVQTLHEFKVVCPVHSLIRNGSICTACSNFNFRNVVRYRCNRGSLARSALTWAESSVSRAVGAVYGVDKFIAVSKYLRDRVVAMGVPPDKIVIVPNFTDAASVTPNFSDSGYFLYFGRIEAAKGIWPLLDAFAQMPDIRLKIVGAGSLLPAVRERAGKARNVEIHPFADGSELSSLISGAVGVLAPSIVPETFGLTLIEAFAHGKPVIASEIGAYSEVISSEKTGLLVCPGNVEQIVGAVRRIRSGSNERRLMGAAARETALTKFGPRLHYERLLEVYDSVLRG